MGSGVAGSRAMRHIHRFLSDQSGLESVEFAIIAGLIVSGLVAIILAIGGWVRLRFVGLRRILRKG
jgi:Flp pilus assembly pilin Flp